MSNAQQVADAIQKGGRDGQNDHGRSWFDITIFSGSFNPPKHVDEDIKVIYAESYRRARDGGEDV